jgi:hypothetical protein
MLPVPLEVYFNCYDSGDSRNNGLDGDPSEA